MKKYQGKLLHQKGVYLLFILWFLLFFSRALASAEEIGVEIEKIDGQPAAVVNYLEIEQLEKKTEVIVNVFRSTQLNQSVSYGVKVLKAGLNQAGRVDYVWKEASLKKGEISPASVVHSADKVTFAENQKETLLKVSLVPTEQKWDGMVMGAIVLFELETEEIVGELPFQIGLGHPALDGNLTIQDFSIVDRKKDALMVTIQNNTNILLSNVELRYAIKEKEGETIHEEGSLSVNFPPQSSFDWVLPVAGETLEKGTYTLEIKAVGANIDKQTGASEFIVNKEHRLQMVLQSSGTNQQSFLYWLSGGLILLLLIGGARWLWLRRQQSDAAVSSHQEKAVGQVKKKRKKKKTSVTNQAEQAKETAPLAAEEKEVKKEAIEKAEENGKTETIETTETTETTEETQTAEKTAEMETVEEGMLPTLVETDEAEVPNDAPPTESAAELERPEAAAVLDESNSKEEQPTEKESREERLARLKKRRMKTKAKKGQG